MVGKKPKPSTLEKSLYTIEKDMQKQIEPYQKNIIALKKRYDDILSRAQKAFEENEQAHQKALNELQKKHLKTTRSTQKQYEESLRTQEKRIETLKQHHQEKTSQLKSDHKNEIRQLTNAIKKATKEKDKILTDIDEKHRKNTKAYQDKIDLHEETLQKNKEAIKKDMDALLKSVQDRHESEKQRLNTLEKALNDDFDMLISRFKTDKASVEHKLKEERNRLDHQINNLRKTINDASKALSKHLYQLGSRLNEPFERLKSELSLIEKNIRHKHKTFLEAVDQDVDSESARLERLMNEHEGDETYQTSMKKQLELNKIRQTALKNHAVTVEKGLIEATSALKTVAEHTLGGLKNTFEDIEKHVTLHQSLIKKRFDIFQQANPNREDLLKKLLEDSNPTKHFEQIKALIHDVLKTLLAFEQKRLSTLYTSTTALRPLYEEADDLRAFLDTKEALKEIKVHKEKIEVEKKDAALRHEMTLRQKNHEKTLATLEYDQTLNESNCLFTIDLEKEKQALKNIKSEMEAVRERNALDEEKKMAKLIYTLRKNHVETDQNQLAERKKLDLKILELEKKIEILETEKRLRLNQEEQREREKQENTRLELMISERKRNLERLNVRINKIEAVLNQQETRQKELLENNHNKEVKRLEQKIDDEKERHEKQIEFIEQAFKRESEKAKTNIDEIKSMINARLNPVKTAYGSLLGDLRNFLKQTKQVDLELKDLLPILTRPFKNEVKDFLTDATKTMEESHTFAYDLELSELDSMENQKKKNTAKQKLEQKYRRQKQQLDNALEARIKRIDETLKKPLETLKKKNSMQLATLQRHVQETAKLLIAEIKAHFESTKTTIETVFEPLYHTDATLLDKAKHSRLQAIEKENDRYKEAMKPLEIQREGLDEKHQDDFENLEESFTEKRAEQLSQLSSEASDIETSIQSLQGQLETILQKLNDAEEELQHDLELMINTIEENYDHKRSNMLKRYTEREEKIKARLEDAQSIYNYAVSNIEKADMDIEQIFQEKMDSAQEQYDYIYQTQHEKISMMKAETKKALEKENVNLKQKLEDYEEQILTSKARLESQIETAIRSLDDEVRIKSTRMKHLIDTINEKEYQLYDAFDNMHETLKESLRHHAKDHIFDIPDHSENLETYFEPERDQFDQYISETIKSITDTE